MDTTSNNGFTTTSTVSGKDAGLLWLVTLIYVAVLALVITAVWKLFKKAGQPGWAAIIPFYNTYVLAKIAGRPDWWFILFFVPFVNIVVLIMLAFDIAKVFGKGPLFAFFGLLLFAPIGYMILGFGKSTYSGPLPSTGQPVTPQLPNPPAAQPPISQPPTPAA